MKVKEVADLVGISVRTLHHYDEIGLLTSEETTESGYRIYSESDLETLQQILFFKELGFPLKKIKEIISSPSFDRAEALELHRKSLLEKRSKLDNMIRTIDKTIQHSKGEIEMSNKEKFEGFDFSSNPYEQEARDRWGDKAVDESNAKINSLSRNEKKAWEDEFNSIYKELAEIRHEAPDSEVAQEGIKEWYDFLNRMGNYSLDAFKGLGQMYVDDERFTKNIDQFGKGLAVFMRDAMAVYADKNK
ncbi:MerR family transcriptional regulator [Virgibacillus profundi]|uniref:MerR family transcriptional regulator n=1 Tax=Virgibacillus profundi TaxID=2024555 RepID=A0A2A2IFE6_9BACI|nr:MerR family transcriptional regulator [Virgibacillus profundi]PAV30489.1 MerR family transcriptional regulator [Virgibacillus profundi]PXY54661.1 MerR family transcriptional regulator [Virgibacillus profundi]